MKTNNNNKQR